MESVLTTFVNGLARTIHRHFHQHFPRTTCSFVLPTFTVRHTDSRAVLVGESMTLWLPLFALAFDDGHNSVAQRLRRLLDSAGGAALSMQDLSLAVDAPIRSLERYFRVEMGHSIVSHRTRRRLIAALTMLRQDPAWSIESVARCCGWSTKKGLFEACRRATGMTPSRLRHLGNAEFEQLLLRLSVRQSTAQRCSCCVG